MERHRIQIPTLKWVRMKEMGYVPTNARVINGTVTEQAGRYYVSVVCEVEKRRGYKPETEPIGVDLGLRVFAVCSNGVVKKNINRTQRVKKLEKKVKREQRRLSRKYECQKQNKFNQKGETTRQNIQKQRRMVQRLYQRLQNLRTNDIRQFISELVKQKPSFITIEDLNVKGMMKNRHLSKAVAQQKFYEFRIKLTNKCKEYGIELRVVDRWYPSSKLCSCCGTIKKELTLSDRMYVCEMCGLVMDRDLQASINLREATTYQMS